MTAGRGVVHSEMPDGEETTHMLQLWINLPARFKMCEPRYQDIRAASMPVVQRPGAEVRVISGTFEGVSTTTVNVVPVLALVATVEPGGSLAIPIPASHTAFAYMLAGTAIFQAAEGAPAQVKSSHVVLFRAREPPRAQSSEVPTAKEAACYGHVTIRATVHASSVSAARFVFFSGPPLREPVAAQGPFVMNTHDEIVQAHNDYVAGRF
jgi:quercetin 2,3-dioxygenase